VADGGPIRGVAPSITAWEVIPARIRGRGGAPLVQRLVGLRAVSQVDVRYLTPDHLSAVERAPMAAVRSDTGTGKTTAALKWVVRDRELPCLLIGLRNAGTRRTIGDFDGCFIDECQSNGSAPRRLGASFRQLNHEAVSTWCRQYPDGVVIVDQADAVIEELLAEKELRSSRLLLWRALAALLGTRESMLLGTNLTPEYLNWYSVLAKRDSAEVSVLENSHVVKRGQAVQVSTPTLLQDEVIQAMKRGEHVLYVSAVRSSVNEMVSRALRECPHLLILVVTGRPEDDRRVQEWQQNRGPRYALVAGTSSVLSTSVDVLADGSPVFSLIALDATRKPPTFPITSVIDLVGRARDTSALVFVTTPPPPPAENASVRAPFVSGSSNAVVRWEDAEQRAAEVDQCHSWPVGVLPKRDAVIAACASFLRGRACAENTRMDADVRRLLALSGWDMTICARGAESEDQIARRASDRALGLERECALMLREGHRPRWAEREEQALGVDRERPDEAYWRMVERDGRRVDMDVARAAWEPKAASVKRDTVERCRASIDRIGHTRLHVFYDDLLPIIGVDRLPAMAGEWRDLDRALLSALHEYLSRDEHWTILNLLDVRAPAGVRGTVRALGTILARAGLRLRPRRGRKDGRYEIGMDRVAARWAYGNFLVGGLVPERKGNPLEQVPPDGEWCDERVFAPLGDKAAFYANMANRVSVLVDLDVEVAAAAEKKRLRKAKAVCPRTDSTGASGDVGASGCGRAAQSQVPEKDADPPASNANRPGVQRETDAAGDAGAIRGVTERRAEGWRNRKDGIQVLPGLPCREAVSVAGQLLVAGVVLMPSNDPAPRPVAEWIIGHLPAGSRVVAIRRNVVVLSCNSAEAERVGLELHALILAGCREAGTGALAAVGWGRTWAEAAREPDRARRRAKRQRDRARRRANAAAEA
jgi:hypothetical protein